MIVKKEQVHNFMDKCMMILIKNNKINEKQLRRIFLSKSIVSLQSVLLNKRKNSIFSRCISLYIENYMR